MKFSIIIALAPGRSAPVLNSLGAMNYPKKNYEIIIEEGLSPSENRNRGIKKAQGDILAIVDDDCIVDKNWLKNAESFFSEHKDIDVVGGPQLTPKSDNLFAKASGYVMSSFFGTYNMSSRYKKGKLSLNATEYQLTSANLFVKKKVFDKVNSFNTDLWPGEDPEFICRVKNSGFKIAYSPNVIVFHKRRPTFLTFFKQFFNYGKVYLQYKNKAEKGKISLVHFIPTIFALYLILLPVFYFINIALVTPFILYFILSLISSTFLTFKNKHISAFPYLPFLFFAIHISYGLGLLRGLFKWSTQYLKKRT